MKRNFQRAGWPELRSAAPRSLARGPLTAPYWLLGGPTAIITRAAEFFGEVEAVAPNDWPTHNGQYP
jgi:hypothetical protein